MRVGVIGPGALGCLVAGKLSEVTSVFLVDNDYNRSRQLNNNIFVNGKDYEIPVHHDLKGLKCDLCVLTVKAYDTESAIPSVKKITSRDSYVLTLQNGVGSVETLLKKVRARIVGGVTCEASTLTSEGRVEHLGRGDTLLKGINHNNISRVVGLFDSAGFQVKEVDDYYKARWRKLIINSGINPASVLTGRKNGELVGNDLMYRLARESHHVGLLQGFSFDFENPDELLDSVCRSTANNKSSMLQDFERGKRTEIDYINGAVVSKGTQYGYDARDNREITEKIRNSDVKMI